MPAQLESVASNLSCIAGSTLPVNRPPGTVDGDLLLFYGTGRPRSGTDWAIGFGATVNTLHKRDNGSVDLVAMHLAWRIASGEPSSYTFTWPASTGTNGRSGFVARISEHDLNTPINVSSEAEVNDPGAPFEIPCPTLTTTINDALILRIVGGQGTGWNLDDGSELSYSGPQAATEELDRACGFNGMGLFREDSLFSPPGAVGVGTVTVAATNTILASGATVAIAPGLTGGGGTSSGGIVLGKEGKPISKFTKADVQAAREHAKTIGAKVKTKFEPRKR